MPTNSDHYSIAFVIGRFHPFHNGHKALFDHALSIADRVVALIGSPNRARCAWNFPFTFDERAHMISETYRWEVTNDRLIIDSIPDDDYNNDAWVGHARATMEKYMDSDMLMSDICIVGHKKDSSSEYLSMFPGIQLVEIPMYGTFSATDIRKNLFQRAPILPHDIAPDATVNFLKDFILTRTFTNLLTEYEDISSIRGRWDGSPYTPHFVTADAVVTQSGHILLVRRGTNPGKGLLALPGGHIVPEVGDAFDNCIKELWEEARPNDGLFGEKREMPKGALRRYYTGTERRFDKPGRDPRGYYLTNAFRFRFPDGKLWEVTGGLPINGEANDSVSAGWYPIGSLRPEEFFADHYFIIQSMLDD